MRLVASARSHGRSLSDTSGRLRLYESDDLSARFTARAVADALASCQVAPGEAFTLAESWIAREDFLRASGRDARFVIANPPYLRIEEIEPARLAEIRARFSTMTGRADLYVAFLEAGLNRLVPEGVLATLCSDRWMSTSYGARLRALASDEFGPEVVLRCHDAGVFDAEVSAYPSVSVIRRGPVAETLVGEIAGAPDDAADIAAQLREVRAGRRSSSSGHVRAAWFRRWASGADPWVVLAPERLAYLRDVEARFGPLEDHATRVRIGVETGADAVFITSDTSVAEPARLLPIALPGDLATGSLRWSGNYLVNPWNGTGLVALDAHPRARAYLEANRTALAARAVARRRPDEWFRTVDRPHLELLARPKLYVADFGSEFNPVLDRGETYPHHAITMIESRAWDLEVLGGLLLGSTATLFVDAYTTKMRGGWLRFQAQFLRRIRVPRPDAVKAVEARALATAFRSRDREIASRVSADIYSRQAATPETPRLGRRERRGDHVRTTR